MVRVRIEGTKDDLEKFIDDFLHFYNPSSISKFYPNTRERYSENGRIYITLPDLKDK